MGAQTVVELSGLTKQYGDVTAVHDLSFSVRRGEFFSILGPSGCGKSTTLRTIAGFENASEGRIKINETDITGTPAHQRETGMVFQGYALFPHKTVSENVGFGLKMDGVPQSEREDRVEQMLATVDLGGFEQRMPSELSGGQQQRVALARALIIEPSVLLLDEPLAALDLQLRQDMRFELQQIQDRLDITTIYVTHDQEEALSMSDRILVLDAGKAQQIDTPRKLYNNPQNQFVADFIGEANILQTRFKSATKDVIKVEPEFSSMDTVSVMKNGFDENSLSTGERVYLNIRPEDITIHPPDKDPEDGLSAEITNKTFIGKTTQFVATVGNNQEILAEASGLAAQQSIATGDTVSLTWSRDDCTIIGEHRV
ncbi:ABC transporter ATP-binding protein [Haloquadratum walsbyi]|uniref:Molybdate/tungstate import ATP-binding protein WtpC n=1 Tax=Haloquadratum walsbyi J07HQW2 TaxID=1238425 RepID=U1PUX4_9EURY|nr:ABC transporter ATP-binding protein [Haloquadratum walsbyi]ERG96191.1 MAG: ABC-type spermidine/putrescine transport system, ATPase component [Haloquadratum walsbyi J07HQW2]